VQEGPGRVTRFHRVRQSLRRLAADGGGATAIEYALIAALVALALFSAIGTVGEGTAALFQKAADGVQRS